MEAERCRAFAVCEASGGDDDEIARLADITDAWDVKIRQAPCRSKRGVILKLQSVANGCRWGERFDAPVLPEYVLAQVIAYLEALP
jgi:hypothetical protein